MALFSDILLTADFDRTLTAPDSTIPARNLEAIRFFMENGGAFTVNTGRSLPMAKVFRDIIPVNAPLLLYNGSAAYDLTTGQFSLCQPIRLDLWDMVAQCMADFPDLMVELQGMDAHYRFTEENPSWDHFCEYNHCAHGWARPGMDLGPFLKLSIYGGLGDGSVAPLFSGTEAEIRRFDEAEALLHQRFGQTCEIFRAAARIIDIHAKGVSKGNAARALQKKLERKLLICVGDADNDLPMLREADYAFSPADGTMAALFPNVCPCAEGSVADVIYKKIPEILVTAP